MISSKQSAPVVGFNHNVQYGTRVYHVQTEDSGLPHAHYISHLFLGGNIVASMKTSYAEKVEVEADLPKTVRGLMEAQHKAMLRRLVSGEFTELAERLSAPHYEPGVLANGQTGPMAVNTGSAAPAPSSAVAPARPAPAAAPGKRPPAAPPKPAPVPAKPPPTPARPLAPAAPRAPIEPVWQPAPPGASTPQAPRMPGGPLPATTRLPPNAPRTSAPPRIVPTMTPLSGSRPVAPARPAAAAAPVPNLFADDRPVEAPHDDLPTIFAEELISGKSLDEVILAFLSADLEPRK